MTYDNDRQRNARLRMENAQAALAAYKQQSQSAAHDQELLLKLRAEVRQATSEFLGAMDSL